ncbi:hypothetical protein RZS08_25110, partial [Arthrospira platensis SPKY1]|nr:hypothetical protein [Arthrospira platensis SPKY1]
SDTTISFGLMSSAMDSRGNLWLGASDGLRFFANLEHIDPATFDPEKEFIPVGREEMGGTMVQSLILYDDSTLIAGNQQGLALIDLKAFYETGKAAVYFMTEEDGFTGNGADQNSIWIDSRKRVWVASDLGAHRF